MADAPGHDPGQSDPEETKRHEDPGFSWGDHVQWLVEKFGSLSALAQKLSALRGYAEDIETIERALRRLRTRGQRDGGTWGTRVLAAFGLPEGVDKRTRWMGAYHSRFTDLPLPVCQDLVRLWDRPPVSDAPASAVWLALAHATCALRGDDRDAAEKHLRAGRAVMAKGPPEARAELMLAEGFVLSRTDPSRVPSILAAVETVFKEEMVPDDKACLYARWIDQLAYEKNRSRDKKPPDYAGAERLYQTIPVEGAPPFALCRRANGLAFSRWKQGFREEGEALARAACEHAGDGGHLRLRAMALNMFARIAGGEEGENARKRALAIAAALEDEALQMRFTHRKGR